MSHLLAISVGPVQEFIAAARRTRDLWFGSHLLSEVSRAVAKAVKEHGNLIFPASSVAGNVANIILVELNAGADPKDIAVEAKKGAQNCWLEFAKEAQHEASGVIRTDIWNDQVQDVIEFYAAWVARLSTYQEDRARVMRLLAGRKNCRDFLPAMGRAGVSKSSLDGQRESVLKDGDRTDWPKKIRLSPGEQLDVVGVTKRLGKKKGESDPRYSSVARVAAETWLQGVELRGELQGLKDACQKLVSKGLNTVREEKYQYFPYEGTIIYKDRHTDLRKELGLGERELDEVAKVLKHLGGEPNPYLAVLVADGDKMGEAISKIDSVKKHQDFSRELAGFATGAEAIVNNSNGALIYAGGDDVLAFVPVDKCLGCARALRNDFHTRLKLTLSVGVAIGHFMENLEDLLEYGRTAQKHSKQPDRDGLAIHLHKRGGAPIQIRGGWDSQLDQRIRKFADLLNAGSIPSKLPYELRTMVKTYERWPQATANDAIQQDLFRLISKKQGGDIGSVRNVLAEYLQNMTAERLLAFAEELLVARQIAAALKQSGEVAS